MANVAPVGQPESGLLASQELKTPQEIPRGDKEVLLVRADDIECLNFRFPTGSLAKDESLIRLFILTCETLGCEDLVFAHGCYKAVNKDCHKVLDESDMFMMFVEFPTPLNLLRKKCFGKAKCPRKYSLGSHH